MTEDPDPPARGTVLFVHGLWMTGAESFLLRRRLAREGWALRVFPYSSMAEPIERVAQRCARFALQLARRTLAPVHLVGHSLGGLVIYRMFETGLLQPDRFSGDFCRVIFLGTPVNGSETGRIVARSRPGRALLGAVGAAELLDDGPRRWRRSAQLGIIAGDKPQGLGRLVARLEGPNDGTVTVAETQLAGATAHCVLPVSHSAMWLSPLVVEQIANFLNDGKFSRRSMPG
ncbi:MAG: alpha/beta fold hydrolase [Casimicrobiaceae bacterium]